MIKLWDILLGTLYLLLYSKWCVRAVSFFLINNFVFFCGFIIDHFSFWGWGGKLLCKLIFSQWKIVFFIFLSWTFIIPIQSMSRRFIKELSIIFIFLLRLSDIAFISLSLLIDIFNSIFFLKKATVISKLFLLLIDLLNLSIICLLSFQFIVKAWDPSEVIL